MLPPYANKPNIVLFMIIKSNLWNVKSKQNIVLFLKNP